jgi:hypothetical protein
MPRLAVALLAVLAFVHSTCHGQWYGSVDFILPTRTAVSGNVFQREITEIVVTDNNGVVIDTRIEVGGGRRLALDLDFVAGGRATVGYQSGFAGVEGSYLVTGQWDTLSSVSDVGDALLASPFTQVGSTPDPAVDENTFASVAYRTDLESAELNLTYLLYSGPNGEATSKVGLRVMSIDEEFVYASSNATTDNLLESSANNRLIGPQLGIRASTPFPGGRVELGLLGGIAYNDVDRVSTFNGVTKISNTGEASLLGELGIEYQFLPHPCLGFRFGYQLLGVSGLGLAPNDLLLTNDHTDEVLYQVLYAGVMVSR